MVHAGASSGARRKFVSIDVTPVASAQQQAWPLLSQLQPGWYRSLTEAVIIN
jgi:hypothetical protein